MKIILNQLETIKLEQELTVPKHFCSTCTRLKENATCDCFQRRVEPDYNKCFNHSSYVSSSIKASFKSLPKDEMDKLIAGNEAAA